MLVLVLHNTCFVSNLIATDAGGASKLQHTCVCTAAHLSTASAKGISLSAATVMRCPCLAHTACCSALSLSKTKGLSCRLDRQRVRVVLEVSCPASSTSSRLLLISASVNLCAGRNSRGRCHRSTAQQPRQHAQPRIWPLKLTLISPSTAIPCGHTHSRLIPDPALPAINRSPARLPRHPNFPPNQHQAQTPGASRDWLGGATKDSSKRTGCPPRPLR